MTEIAFSGAAQQARMLAEGRLTAPDLVELYLERISRLDGELNTFRVVFAESARAHAVCAQRRLDAGVRLPLLGVPIAIKDDVDVAGQVTAVGTNAYGPPKKHDAEVVRRLRAAGAVILGKTNLPELTIWPFTESLSFGATRNPWNTDYAPGGSSGGTAAAVAAGLAPLGLGSDTAGSIRIPGTWCGLFGLKPQRDRIPMEPRVDAGNGMTVYGPLTRTVEDAALFMDAITTLGAPEGGYVAAASRPPGKLTVALSTKVPRPLRAPVGAAQREAVAQAGDVLRALGHEVVHRDPDYPAGLVAHVIPRYIRSIRDDANAMARPERLEQRSREMARLGGLVSDRRIKRIRAGERTLAERVLSIFDDVDVVITPGTAAGPPRVGAYQRRGAVATLMGATGRVPFHAVFNATGQPAAVVPWGRDESGLPTSIHLIGRPFAEATLLALSAQLEGVRPWAYRRPPAS